MLSRPLLVLLAALAAPLLAQEPSRELDLDEELEDWHLVDVDLDGRVEVLLFFADDDAGKPYRIVRRDERGRATLGPRGHLPANTIAFAFRTGGEPRRRGLVLLTPEAFRPAPLGADDLFHPGDEIPLSRPGFFRAAREGAPALWHWDRDVDGDGRDDLLLPVDDGVVLRRGGKDGGFAPPVAIPLPTSRTIEPSAPEQFSFTRSLPHPIFADVTGDGRSDLAWFDGEGLGFAPQDAEGHFGAARRFALPWLADAEGGVVEQTDVSLTDLDGDGRDDLLLSRMRADRERVTDMKTTLVALLQQKGAEPFGRRPDLALVIPGVVGVGPTLLDCDGDGRRDLVVGAYGSGISDLLSRLVKRVPITFHVYLGLAKGVFSDTPATTVKVNAPQAIFSSFGARHAARIAPDLDGDGVVDLVTVDTRSGGHAIELRPGSTASGLAFAAEAKRRVEIGPYRALSLVEDRGKTTELLAVAPRKLVFVSFAGTD
ncbi:MAG: VCBS repeat-containing protein [Planctomycetota bacterium]